MAKRRVGDILNESFKNKKCNKIKIKLSINREKNVFIFSSLLY